MLHLQADTSTRHVKSGQCRPEPRIPLKKSAAHDRYKILFDHGEPSTLALLKATPGIECVAHGGWGKGRTGRPSHETTAATDAVTAADIDSRGSTNGKRATTNRLNALKRQSLEAKGHRSTKKQATVAPTTARNCHSLQTAGSHAIKIAKAVDNTGPRQHLLRRWHAWSVVGVCVCLCVRGGAGPWPPSTAARAPTVGLDWTTLNPGFGNNPGCEPPLMS